MAKRRGRGEGSIEQLPSGRFRVVLPLEKGPGGERRKLTGTFDTKREALDWRDEQQELKRRSITPGGGRMTVAAWLGQWLDSVKSSVAPNSWEFYAYHVRAALAPQLGRVRLGELTATRVEKMYADLLAGGASADAARKAGTVLGVALQKAVRDRLIPFNPASRRSGATKPAPTHATGDTIRALTPDEVGRLLAAARGDRLYALYVLWLDSGAREGELFGLDWGDVDWPGGAVRIVRSLEEIKGKLRVKDVKTKGSRRRVALSPFTMDALNEHRRAMLAEGHYRPDAPVFCDSKGGRLRKSNFQRRSFDKVLRRACLPHMRPYDLRHSSASLLLLANEPAKVVSERLGHSTVTLTLNTYSHVLPGMQERAAAKLDTIFRAANASAGVDSPTGVPQAANGATG
jgi:integrase